MLIAPHVAVGAAIGANVSNPYVVVFLAIISHFILDALPHFDWGTWHSKKDFNLEKKDYLLLAVDILIVIYFAYIFRDNIINNTNILVGAFFAILPDLIDNVPFWKNYVRKIPIFAKLHNFHERIHYRLKIKYWYWGVISQIIIIGGSIVWLVK